MSCTIPVPPEFKSILGDEVNLDEHFCHETPSGNFLKYYFWDTPPMLKLLKPDGQVIGEWWWGNLSPDDWSKQGWVCKNRINH